MSPHIRNTLGICTESLVAQINEDMVGWTLGLTENLAGIVGSYTLTLSRRGKVVITPAIDISEEELRSWLYGWLDCREVYVGR